MSERHEEIIEEWMIRAMDWKARAEKAEAAIGDVLDYSRQHDYGNFIDILAKHGYGDEA